MTIRSVILAGLVLALLAPGCREKREVPEDYFVTWELMAPDAPPNLARRIYGRLAMAAWIIEINEDKLNDEGYFEKGTKIKLPPDTDGRPVDISKIRNPIVPVDIPEETP